MSFVFLQIQFYLCFPDQSILSDFLRLFLTTFKLREISESDKKTNILGGALTSTHEQHQALKTQFQVNCQISFSLISIYLRKCQNTFKCVCGGLLEVHNIENESNLHTCSIDAF